MAAEVRDGATELEGCAGRILQVRSLSYRYAKVEVWSEVSFALQAGQVAFLEGPNGAGKSTLLRCLAGWDAPSAGEAMLFGKRFDGTDRASRRLVSFVPDVPVFYDDLTADEHVRFVLEANRVSACDGRAEQLMAAFGLARFGPQLPSSYSRGMRQKLALVLAFVIRPRLLLLDEPYGPLDPGASAVLSGLLVEARDSGAAVLVSSHHDVPGLVPDLVLRLAEGCLGAEGLAREEGPGTAAVAAAGSRAEGCGEPDEASLPDRAEVREQAGSSSAKGVR